MNAALSNDRLAASLAGLRWFGSTEDFLEDPTIVGVVCEGDNSESLEMTKAIINAGKHCWLDKPAGDNWTMWHDIAVDAGNQGLQIQLGYMLRYK